jgi:hypothetical protein
MAAILSGDVIDERVSPVGGLFESGNHVGDQGRDVIWGAGHADAFGDHVDVETGPGRGADGGRDR